MESADREPEVVAARVATSLERVAGAVADARGTPPSDGAEDGSPDGGRTGSDRFLAALALLRALRAEMATWEPDLIDAARREGASWKELASVLGVASRQAAERRYLRLRPATAQAASTGDQRVRAERDRRAADRAVRGWARDHAADLRQLAGQISGLGDLPAAGDGHLDGLRRALGGDDAADLLAPLADTYHHLAADHPALADRVDALARDTETVRRESHDRRRGTTAPGD